MAIKSRLQSQRSVYHITAKLWHCFTINVSSIPLNTVTVTATTTKKKNILYYDLEGRGVNKDTGYSLPDNFERPLINFEFMSGISPAMVDN